MFRKYFTYFLIVVLLNLPLFAQTNPDKKAAQEATRVAKLKTAMTAIGLGDASPVELKLKNGSKIIGYISEIKDGSIVFAETALARSVELTYAEINAVKPYKPKVRRPVNWSMVLTIAAVVAVTAIAIKVCNDREKRGETCDSPETY